MGTLRTWLVKIGPTWREWVHLLIGALLGVLLAWPFAAYQERRASQEVFEQYDELLAQQFVTRMAIRCPPKDSWDDQTRVAQFKQAMTRIRARIAQGGGVTGAPAVTPDCNIGVNWSASFQETLGMKDR